MVRFNRDGKIKLYGDFSDPRYFQPNSGYYWRIDTSQGQVLKSRSLGTADLPSRLPPSGVPQYSITDGPTGEALLVSQTLLSAPDLPTVHIAVATDQRIIAAETARINNLRSKVNGIAALLAVAFALLAVWLVVRPMRRFPGDIASLEKGVVTRLNGVYPADLQPVVNTLNRVLDNYEALAEHARWHAASVAHNVRGVLAILLDDLEQLTARSSPPVSDFSAVVERCRQIEQHLEDHVRRVARPAGGSTLNAAATVKVEPVLERVLAAVQKLHRDRGLDWNLGVGPDCQVRCSTRELGEMAFSLLDNAGKWAKHQVSCDWWIQGPWVVIEIGDDGPGFKTSLMNDCPAPAVGSPYKPADTQPRGSGEALLGLGVGLEITMELARLQGGQASLGKSKLGGARVTLLLPAAPV